MVHDQQAAAVDLIARIYTDFTADVARYLQRWGLTPAQFEIMRCLARSVQEPLRLTDVANGTSLSNSGVTRAVDSLVRRGLVLRVTCPSDRRSSPTALTKAGLDYLNRALPGYLALVDRLTQTLNTNQLTTLTEGLRAIAVARHEDGTEALP
jgi:MarR family 2-MHQ and catechol resistance regulon transcriptional repressor